MIDRSWLAGAVTYDEQAMRCLNTCVETYARMH